MKKFIFLSLLTFSFQSFAADLDKYCLPFLNGKLDGQEAKPSVMEGFVASKVKMDVAGSLVDTINIQPEDIESRGDVKVKTYAWGEETTMEILKFKKNGKQVRDFRLVVSRDKSGNLISVARKNFRSNTIYFKPQKDVCAPESFIDSHNKLKFSVELCREIDRFFAENPAAKECLVARHDQKLASLVKEYARGLGEKLKLTLEKNDEDMSALYAATHRVNCSENGVDSILNDKSLWDTFVGRRGEEKLKIRSGDEE